MKEDEPCSGESFIFGGSVQWVKELFDQEAGGINGSLSTLINDDSGRRGLKRSEISSSS